MTEEIPNLRSADIHLETNGINDFAPLENLDIHVDEKKVCVQHTTSLLEAVRSTKELSLNAQALLVAFAPPAVWKCQPLRPLRFQNLKCLNVETWLSRDCVFAIIELLRISPKIETLILNIVKDGSSRKPLNWNEEILTSSNVISKNNGFPKQCTFHHLKVVEIHGVIGCMNELMLLEIVLRNSLVLKKMVVRTIDGLSYDRKKGLANFSEILLRIPQASSKIGIMMFQEL
ncbi:hypothetical protein Sjap_002851 [Stephania japonica]|uniref:FBD domain-containing protein n=1 Tax=Stephania japonica TaxID=461633 RepID=A0AAP0KMU7_9MAGN